MFKVTSNLKPQTVATASLLLGLSAFNAEATLTSYTSRGQNVVYSSVSNVTWIADTNLLGSMMKSQGYAQIVNAIIAASPWVMDTPNVYAGNDGRYFISSADFSTDISAITYGQTSWFGAKAFINYLNSINYAGSSQWSIPTAGDYPQYGQPTIDNQFTELYYSELGGTYRGFHPDQGPFLGLFAREFTKLYWFDTEYVETFPNKAWLFGEDGAQGISFKKFTFYAWAFTPGQISAVPVPSAIWLMGSGLLGLLGLKRRSHAA